MIPVIKDWTPVPSTATTGDGNIGTTEMLTSWCPVCSMYKHEMQLLDDAIVKLHDKYRGSRLWLTEHK